MPSVSCISPIAPGAVRSRQANTSGASMYLPTTARFEGASSGAGFSTNPPHLEDATFHLVGIYDTVGADSLPGNLLHRDHAGPVPLVHVQHLAAHGHISHDHIVWQHHDERLIPDGLFGSQHSMAQPKLLLLHDGGDLGQGGDASDHLRQPRRTSGSQPLLQIERREEELLQARLPGRCDQDYLLHSGIDQFLHTVLDHGLVQDGKQLLGNSLGGGEEASAQPGSGNDSLAYLRQLCHGCYSTIRPMLTHPHRRRSQSGLCIDSRKAGTYHERWSCARRGASGALYPQSAAAGLNSSPRLSW